MLGMFLYTLGIMYSPGPMNFMGMNIGISGKIKKSMGYYAGVGLATFTLCIIFGYTGEKIIKKEYLLYVSVVGSIYICYLAYKIWNSKAKVEKEDEEDVGNDVGFVTAYIGQAFNPKALIAFLPLAVIYFPVNNILGLKILFFSMIFGSLAFFAPLTYSVAGSIMGNVIKSGNVLKAINRVMAVFLFILAAMIVRDHVYLVLMGVNAY